MVRATLVRWIWTPSFSKLPLKSQQKHKIIAIVGPTASGKSDLGIFLAQKLNGEIVSADSRQVYKGMDIGTGKVSKREQNLVPHHLLDVASPKREFTVSHYQKIGRTVIADIIKRNRLPIIVGGTGFYIDALLKNYDLPNVPPQKELRKELEQYSAETLFEQLTELDHHRASMIDPHNKRRLIRAIEIVRVTGKPVQELKSSEEYDILYLGLLPSPKELADTIKSRLDARIRQGLIGEVRNLIKEGVTKKRLHALGLEYRWVTLFLQERIAKGEMRAFLTGAIVHYAKRQMTWFKRNKDINWIKTNDKALQLSRKFLARP